MFFEIAIGAGAGAATLARLITKEEGPFKIFPRFRDWAVANVRTFETAHPERLGVIGFFNEALSVLECPICQSCWWGTILAMVCGLAVGLNPVMVVLAMLAAPSIAWAIGSLGLW